MKIAIIGKGNVGNALGEGLKRGGHEIRFGHRDPKEPVRKAAEWGDAIILAVPYHATIDVAKEIGSAADGKVIIDVRNPLDHSGNLAVGFTTSAAEEPQKLLPNSRVVKAFNSARAFLKTRAREEQAKNNSQHSLLAMIKRLSKLS